MANFLQRGLARLAGIPLPPENREVNDPRFWGGDTTASQSGQAVTAETAMQLDVVQAVLTRLAGTISTLPMMVFERLDNDERKPAKDHPLYRILHDAPNARQTAQEFRDEQERHLAFYRNCYSEIIPGADGHPIGSLEPIHPDRMIEVKMTGAGVSYRFRSLDGVSERTLHADRIWHIRKAPLTVNGLQGRPMHQTARETFGRAQAVEQFGAMYFANGGSGGGIIKFPGTFKDKEAQTNFLEAWRSGGAGLNRHKDRLLLGGAEYTPFKVDNDEAQFIETLKLVSLKLARLWNMPPHMVGIMDNATFTNIEQQSTEYAVHTLSPDIAAWEQAAQRDLLIGDDQQKFFIEINVAGLLRGDFKTRWQSYAWGRQWGWLSINDVRRLENLPSIGEEGDEYLTPMNMVPAGTIPNEPADDAVKPPPKGNPNEP